MNFEANRIDSGPLVDQTFERMMEIISAVDGTGHPNAEVEYSALFCAGVLVLCASKALDPDQERVQRVLRLVVNAIAPIVADEIERQEVLP
jgi:hypothetical protein